MWDVFRGVANTADEEALEQHLADEARRDEFYDRLNAFSKTLAIALSSHEFANEPSNQRRIAGYRDDLRRFENLRRAVRTRYQDAVDYGQYRKRIEKLLDTYVVADDVRPMTDLVNIFDEDAFAEVLNSNASPASRADSSHTSSGRILLNDMLIAARRDCIDYVIVHELCHVVEPNHSPRFFRLLNRHMPDWERRKELLEKSMI